MTKKYELIESDNLEKGPHRIRAVRTFGGCDSRSRSILVREGTIGGYVHNNSNLSHEGDAWIGDNATVGPGSYVTGDAVICGDAILTGTCSLYDRVLVYGDAHLTDVVMHNESIIFGSAVVEEAYLYSNAHISGTAKVTHANLYTGAQITAGTIRHDREGGWSHLSVTPQLIVRHDDVVIESPDHYIVVETSHGPLCVVRTINDGKVGFRMTVGCQDPDFEGLIRRAKRSTQTNRLLAAGFRAWVEPVLRSWGVEDDPLLGLMPSSPDVGDDDDDD